jgi:phosphatidylglycerol:prolipoprotein diacylglycerol transferase
VRQTLFYIPQQVAGVPLLGVGILLALLIVASVVGVWIAWRRGRMNDVWGQAPLVVVLGLLVTVILPRIAEESGLPVRGFGVALLAAVMSGVWLAVVRARRRNVDPEVIYSLAVWLFIGGIVAARHFT